METSCFSRIKLIAPPAYPVAISRGLPKWYAGKRYQTLAPTWKMLKLPDDDFERLMRFHLSELDPAKVFDDVGEDAVLLCWEAPPKLCHRRLVAEWLEDKLGLLIPELGFTRPETTSYAAMMGRTPLSQDNEPVRRLRPLGPAQMSLI